MKQRQRKVKLLMQNQLTVQEPRQETGKGLSPMEIALVGERTWLLVFKLYGEGLEEHH